MTHRVAVAAYVFCEDKLLLLRRTSPPCTLAPPGGKLEPDEDPVAGLLREVREETGLTIDVLGVAHVWFGVVYNGQPPRLCINFVAETAQTDVALSVEHNEYAWVARQQIECGEVTTLTSDGFGYRPEHILAAFDVYERLRCET